MNINFRILLAFVATSSTALLLVDGTQFLTPGAENSPSINDEGRVYPASSNRSPARASTSLTFVVPQHVTNSFKRKCYICHGGTETKGGFNLKQMTYQSKRQSNWRPMDLAGVTRIKLAILPIDGKPARMPRRAGSILNPLSVEEANAIAQWTDYPYEK